MRISGRLVVVGAALAISLSARPAVAQLSVAVEVGPGPARPGDTLAVDVTTTNTGASAVADVRIEVDKTFIGFPSGPKCAACTGTGSVPLPCTAGTTGNCF
jgi:hypothetical protein